MDHPAAVGVGDRLAHLLERREQPAPVGPLVGEQVGQGPPLDQLHDQERPAVRQGADLVDRGDARVLELGGDPGLAQEPPGGRAVGLEPGVQELDRHVPGQPGVPGPVHHPHPALPHLLGELVPGRVGLLDDPRHLRDGAACGGRPGAASPADRRPAGRPGPGPGRGCRGLRSSAASSRSTRSRSRRSPPHAASRNARRSAALDFSRAAANRDSSFIAPTLVTSIPVSLNGRRAASRRPWQPPVPSAISPPRSGLFVAS